jgi:periplasmic divalent cation tolerance protein
LAEADYQLILSTCPDHETASRIAEMLVNDHLAACVNILPGIQSAYQWKGKVEISNEVLLLIKSHRNRYTAIQTRIRQLHPYELPEIIAVPISQGLPEYLSWLDQPE